MLYSEDHFISELQWDNKAGIKHLATGWQIDDKQKKNIICNSTFRPLPALKMFFSKPYSASPFNGDVNYGFKIDFSCKIGGEN